MSDTAFRIGKLEANIGVLRDRVSKVNPCHESSSGRFCSTSGGGGAGATSASSSRKGVAEAIGAEFDPATARVIGNRTSMVKRVPGGGKERKAIAGKLKAQGYKQMPGRSKAEDVFSASGGKSVVSVKQQRVGPPGRKSNSLLVEHVVQS